MTSYTSETLAQIYIREIVHLRGVSISIISDRGIQCTSHFWRVVKRELGSRGSEYCISPSHDGQSEWTIKILNEMLRACVIDFGGQNYPYVRILKKLFTSHI